MKRIRTGHSGVQLVTCNQACAASWQLAHIADVAAGMSIPVVDEITARPKAACVACAWCGTTLATPANDKACFRHGTDCPATDVLASDYCRQALRRVSRETGAELSDYGWHLLRAALELHGSDVPKVVAAMVRMQPEWDTLDATA